VARWCRTRAAARAATRLDRAVRLRPAATIARIRRPIDIDNPRAQAVLARVRSVPRGRVTTYADLSPEAPRYAGAVLHAVDDPGVPWQRIVRADGSLAKGDRQRRLLEAEGVPFSGERVDMHAAWVEPG
jgi:methylated-DNA-protein-cysteine methyltransferase related protein